MYYLIVVEDKYPAKDVDGVVIYFSTVEEACEYAKETLKCKFYRIFRAEED
jgi:hypothetical protein